MPSEKSFIDTNSVPQKSEMVSEQIEKQWDKMASSYEWSGFEKEVVEKEFVKTIGEVQNKKILDLGSGPGNMARILAKNGASVTGIERSEGMLNRAKKEEEALSQGIRYFQSDLMKIDEISEIKEELFEKGIFSFVLHNIDPVENMSEILKKASEKIIKGGQIIALDPHAVTEYMHHTKDTTREAVKEGGYKEHFQIKITLNSQDGSKTIIQHKHRTLGEYINAFAKAGLRIVEFREITAPEELKNEYPDEYKTPFFQIIVAEKM
ncbi:MAG: hypothetical protein A2271_03740 [Candidatus Moranbacteria bacterium RIFOXYA12_FULL_35_19]|nr:MAG: Methylase [Candidatus Moranbacteria bacterium GW2011_GWF2_35_39]OGI31839.1 MAG: hypothetical protein A2343_01325 [Candidatus Moranbacteria bacterium RIFOXYB12_FULL_35_8]OGI33362.1 MAG: hypothetical protein A2489_03875 [Candidatus Moranbacteria bacterium RIFOXYC12_FULL_36_13]OGI36288.1 MAG: hypothetical protein A2271_03740 [Candidatus Moranbacteria bacterium RIFOXYA12_FULL_35_19]